MKKVRTHLEDRVLPSYTKGEEIFNMVSHIAGGALAIAALVLCVIFAVIHTDAWGVVGAAIYGSTMVVLYAMSSIYHGLKPEMPKKVFQVIDHCTIYFLIAGTYTPVTLTALRPQYPVQAFVIFGIVWACCFIAATLTAFDLKKYKVSVGFSCRVIVNIENDVVKEGITVPLSAVVFDNNLNSKIVFIYNPSTQKVELRKVSDEGIIVGRNDLIVSGNIEPGEQVVSAGASYLVDGQQVKILTE